MHIGSTQIMPSKAQIDAVLAFLPLIEDENFSPGHWHQPESEPPWCVPGYIYSDVILEFSTALYEHGFILREDWAPWEEMAEDYMENPEKLSEADLRTLQKLLTVHIRADRFCDGHLAYVVEKGHFTAILRRLKEIRQEMH